MAVSPRRNIELKARLDDLPRARGIVARLADGPASVERQTDTYFHCRAGRLKLREIDGRTAILIAYARVDEDGPKASDYQLIPVDDPDALRQALASALGIRAIVQKRREIFLWDNVRIHLDNVATLGTFIEFEAVLDAAHTDRDGHAQLDRLIAELGIPSADLLSGSYGEMIMAQ